MFENISGYDDWKLANPFDGQPELCECDNCRKEILKKDAVWSGSMDVCDDCYKEINRLIVKVNNLLKPLLTLKAQTLKRKLGNPSEKLPEIMAMNWLKKELIHYGIEKSNVRINDLNTEELEIIIEILEGLHSTNKNLKAQEYRELLGV